MRWWMTNRSVDVFLGSQFLAAFTVVIDLPHGVIALSPQGSQTGTEKPGIGLSLRRPTTGGDYLAVITPGGGAERAGLRNSDIVLAVNGRDITKSEAEEMMSITRRAIEAWARR